MTRLQAELRRLYLLPAAGRAGVDVPLLGAGGEVRGWVLEVALPSGWSALQAVWHGVQADLDLPAPAIAVNGRDAYQLWFSVAEPVPLAQAAAFLGGLRTHYLDGVAADRIAIHPTPTASDVRTVPSADETGHWSAFLAPDLAPLFAEEPWLDLTPGDDAQADLLSRLQSAKPAAFRAALEKLSAPVAAEPAVEAPMPTPAPRPEAATVRPTEPREFLLHVMNDPAVELALRVEAAKALLGRGERA